MAGPRAIGNQWAQEVLAAETVDEEPIVLRPGETTPDLLKQAEARVADREGRLQTLAQQRIAQLASRRESRFARDLAAIWREGQWVQIIGQFANGQPLCEQVSQRVQVIEIFLAAMNQRMMGEKSPPGAEEEFGAGETDGRSNYDQAGD